MPNINDRGMIKWQPFDSVTTTSKIAPDILKKKNKIPMPILSSDQIDEIANKIMEAYYNQEEIIIFYYRNGLILNKKSLIKYLDRYKKQLILNDHSILYCYQITKIE